MNILKKIFFLELYKIIFSECFYWYSRKNFFDTFLIFSCSNIVTTYCVSMRSGKWVLVVLSTVVMVRFPNNFRFNWILFFPGWLPDETLPGQVLLSTQHSEQSTDVFKISVSSTAWSSEHRSHFWWCDKVSYRCRKMFSKETGLALHLNLLQAQDQYSICRLHLQRHTRLVVPHYKIYSSG